MVRSELLQKMCNLYPNILRKDMEKVIEIIFLEFTKALCKGENIEIRGFGTFSKKINKEKFVRNPRTNEKIYKNKTYKIHFKIGKILHQKINNNHSNDE